MSKLPPIVNYDAIDAAIIASIRAGRPIRSMMVNYSQVASLRGDVPLHEWYAVIDSRLQSLKRQSRIRFLSGVWVIIP